MNGNKPARENRAAHYNKSRRGESALHSNDYGKQSIHTERHRGEAI